MDALAYKDDFGTPQATQNSLQLIAFSIGEQTYGVEITTVRDLADRISERLAASQDASTSA